MARGFTALLDGLVLQCVEEGDSYRRADTERRALAFLDLVAPRPPGPDELVGAQSGVRDPSIHRPGGPGHGRGRRSAKRGAHTPIPMPNAAWPRNMIRFSRAASPVRRPNQP